MRRKRKVIAAGLAWTAVLGFSAAVIVWLQMPGTSLARSNNTLVDTVRQVTSQFKNVEAAKQADYAAFHGCVSGPEEGAMGIHYVKGSLVGDGIVDANHPEALLYEFEGGQLRLMGVEYIVIAADWDSNPAHNGAPPVLQGQVFQYVGAPNRFHIPAFYELHVWAWKHNPDGVFSDFNSDVSCDDFTG